MKDNLQQLQVAGLMRMECDEYPTTPTLLRELDLKYFQ
jgi:hypothetical protein